MYRKFLSYGLIFFLPVVTVYIAVEHFTRNIPSAYPLLEKQIETRSDSFQTLILGSSQIMSGINPEWLDSQTLNLASGSQHHDTDFKLLKGLVSRLPNLKTVILEVSYSHFELPHNGSEYWKNSIYLKYYDINCFDRFTYFKDELLYLSNPKVFSERLKEYYIDGKAPFDYNEYGFNYADTYEQFTQKSFNKDSIAAMKRFKINLVPNLSLYEKNKALFFEMLDYLKAHNLKVIICTIPMYQTYLDKRVPEILARRNEVLNLVSKRYDSMYILNREESGQNYSVKDFWNQSHLSPSGAKKFTHELNEFLKDLP